MSDYEYLKKIPAKPAQYKGLNFKSTLEAQWAAFFDELELPWQYEKDAIRLPDGTFYISDFTLHNEYNYAVYEMKPKGVTSKKFKAAQTFIDDANYDHWMTHDEFSHTETFLMQGSLYDHYMTDFYHLRFCYRCGFPSSDGWGQPGAGIGRWEGSSNFQCYSECYTCDCNTFSGGGNLPEYSSATKLYYTPHKGLQVISKSTWLTYYEKITKAAERVLQPKCRWFGEEEKRITAK